VEANLGTLWASSANLAQRVSHRAESVEVWDGDDVEYALDRECFSQSGAQEAH